MYADRRRSRQRFAHYALAVGAMTLTAMPAMLADAAADPTTAPATPTTTATPTTSPAAGAVRADEGGYRGSAAHCDASQVAMAFGRTARSLVAICVERDGRLEYRGVRLSDQASTRIPASRAADGSIIAANDGVTYAVSPTMLLVSEGDSVLYRDAWVEFRQPRFSDDAPKSSTSATPTTASTSAATVPTTTVATTTVTPAPNRWPGN